jgi:hypothetical protein
MPADKQYQAHYRFCVKLGRRVTWEEFLASPKTGKVYAPGRFGPPGAKAKDILSRRHRQYCYYFRKYLTWDEYQARLNDPKKPRNQVYTPRENSLSLEAIAARVERNRDMLRRKGLLAV